jgi:D-beta-D-heptose 7-phosphate kinase/D-beta-D-heptose 1-phosphate adenosyltransferase
VVSDYAKGVVTEELIGGLQVQNHPYIVDPKDKPFQWYGKALVLTPNEKEYRKIVCGGDEDVRDMYDCLRGLEPEHPGQGMLVKRGDRGAKLFVTQDIMWQFAEDFKVRAREVGDPAGCGDSLIAGLAYALSLGWPLFQACRLAVAAGACAYDHTGVYSVQREDLVKELKSFDY